MGSTANTNDKVPTPSNPSNLKPRYEIRQLGPEHRTWVAIIVFHANCYRSPVWRHIYAEDITKRLRYAMEHGLYIVDHQIASGLSYGVFDTEYVYKHPESKALGGKFYWENDDNHPECGTSLESESLEKAEQRILDLMDFPLVSVALSYDGINALDMGKMQPILDTLPLFGTLYHLLEEADQRDPETWKPTAAGQVLMRNATATRHDYEGEKIMSGLARWLMREAALKGFRGIQIETAHDAVSHVWSKAEEPHKGIVVGEVNLGTYKDEKGELLFAPSKQVCKKVWVELKSGGE